MPVVNAGLETLNPCQREAVLHGEGPLLILAGAGTGKTRVITYRIARLIEQGFSPHRILAVTFTNKAAEEMRRRVDELAPGCERQAWVSTFHSFANRLLRLESKEVSLSPHFTIFDEEDQKKLIREALAELGLEDQKNKAGLYLALISRAKDDLLDCDSYAIHTLTSSDAFRPTVAKVYQAYQKKLEKLGGLDFGDLLMKAVWLLREKPAVRERYQNLFQHILIDEYQDTNHAQYRLVKILAEKHRNLCVVGDDDQSIYKFRGADIRNILEFEQDFQGARVVTLEQNYRSTQNILDAAWKVVRRNLRRKTKKLWTENSGGEKVRVQEASCESEEAAYVARRIQSLLEEGFSLRDFAVFYRTNAQSRSFEEAFRHARFPYVVVGAVRFYERREVKDALAYARVLVNPSDDLSLFRILNVPHRGIGKQSREILEKIRQNQGQSLWEVLERAESVPGLGPSCRNSLKELRRTLLTLQEQAGKLPASQTMRLILETSGYLRELEEQTETDPDAASRINNLQELVNAMKEFEEEKKEQNSPGSLAAYLEEVALQSAVDSYSEEDSKITLMTVHLAKGLEFPAVFVTGLEEGLFPIGSGASDEDLEEERRLAYVAMTRAKKLLHLTYSNTRRLFGQTYYNLPSRFIEEAEVLPPSDRPAPADRPRLAEAQTPALKMGTRVRHPDFGEGRIIEKSGSGEAMKVTVLFDTGSWKKLLLRYAPLEVVG